MPGDGRVLRKQLVLSRPWARPRYLSTVARRFDWAIRTEHELLACRQPDRGTQPARSESRPISIGRSQHGEHVGAMSTTPSPCIVVRATVALAPRAIVSA